MNIYKFFLKNVLLPLSVVVSTCSSTWADQNVNPRIVKDVLKESELAGYEYIYGPATSIYIHRGKSTIQQQQASNGSDCYSYRYTFHNPSSQPLTCRFYMATVHYDFNHMMGYVPDHENLLPIHLGGFYYANPVDVRRHDFTLAQQGEHQLEGMVCIAQNHIQSDSHGVEFSHLKQELMCK